MTNTQPHTQPKLLPLEPLSFPLQGRQLIEASAGTGKTYTITALYLRLLLGLGDINQQPLGPDQILVVTFTEAATEELRDRIRQRIIAARSAFLSKDATTDPILSALREQCTDHALAVKLLEQAARQMDEAAIFTIHSFCQRMLKQHAFESGSLFETELSQDSLNLLRQATVDFWRNEVYPLGQALTQQVLDIWKSPDALLADLRGFIQRSGVEVTPDLADKNLNTLFIERQQAIHGFKQAWLANDDDLQELIQTSGINKRSYTKASLPKWLAAIDTYAASELMEPHKDLSKTLARFTQTTLNEKSSAGNVPQHPLFEAIENLLNDALPIKEVILSRAFKDVLQRLTQSKLSGQLQTFDDLLINLHSALTRDETGTLANAVVKQFPVAMIDEFQDTDPVQYEIFTTIYADEQASALVMIGDPKQAIYAFRGADIFTYIRARRSVPQTFTLEKNWRSTQGMVAAVNQMFLQSTSPFIYDSDIPFLPVTAAKASAKCLQIEGNTKSPLTIWFNDVEAPISKQEYLTLFASSCAAEIDKILSGNSSFTESISGQNSEDEKNHRISGGDIAVLVRDRQEAEAIQQALSVYQHPSVYLSNRDSVFNSPQAVDLSLLLKAIENPLNERALRAALATDFLQLTALELDQLNQDEWVWQSLVDEFTSYHQTWQRHGILPLVHRLLHQRNLAAKTLAQPQGERALTDLLHLAELLQQARTEVEGMSGLMRWFNEQILNAASEQDEQIMRLESERNVVTIVTVHKSKGLEYPIVFLPFASAFKESKTAFYHEQSGRAVLDLTTSDEAMVQAEQERLAEDLRLLYVALTRSVYACYVGISPIKKGNSKACHLHKSAIGHLLLADGQCLSESLMALSSACDAISIEPPTQDGSQADSFNDKTSEPQLKARAFSTNIDRNWRVSSYSALSRHRAGHSNNADDWVPEIKGVDLEVAQEGQGKPHQDNVVDAERIDIFTFPKGANAGTFLHSIFEEISFTDFSAERYSEQIKEQILVAGYEEHWLPVIIQLVEHVLQADLDGRGLKLGNISDANRLVEMEFMLRSDNLEVDALERLIRRYDPLSAMATPVAFDPLKGMLKGFIDLLFRHEGKYYVLDYKSNFLGFEQADYSQAAMEAVMVDHRYELQYLLYSLAVHRLLKSRIPDYDYDQHFGGVYYLFLRGISNQGNMTEMKQDEQNQLLSQTGIFSCRPEKALIEQLDSLFTSEATLIQSGISSPQTITLDRDSVGGVDKSDVNNSASFSSYDMEQGTLL